jgi:hypothetical protein
MTLRYAKTAKGREEITSKSGKLPRTARNLLLILDATRPATTWAALIHGSSQADIAYLVQHGLIEQAAHADPGPRTHGAVTSVEAAIATLGYEQLYNLLTSQAKERLGLIKGFKMVLDVEKCANESELRTLAVKFVGMVREVQGEPAAKTMRLALGMAG